MLITTEPRYQHYKANEDSILLQNDLLFRKCYGGSDNIKYYQNFIPKQLVCEVHRSLHGEFGKHAGLNKSIVAYRQKYCYPNVAQFIRNGSCHVSNASENHGLITASHANHCKILLNTFVQQKMAWRLFWCQNYFSPVVMKPIVTAMDVFSRYLSAFPTSKEEAKTLAIVILNNMSKRDYLPSILISEKGSAFVSQKIKEVTGLLGNILKHALKLGILERSHASIKEASNIETGDWRSLKQNYVSVAILIRTHLITQVLTVSQAECSMDAFLILYYL